MTMKVIVLGGFLGSGKTSVLLQLAEFQVARSIKGKSAMLSTTGDTVQVKEAHHPAVILNLAVIVFIADEAALANQVSVMIEKLS